MRNGRFWTFAAAGPAEQIQPIWSALARRTALAVLGTVGGQDRQAVRPRSRRAAAPASAQVREDLDSNR